jgi:hypothetical protein
MSLIDRVLVWAVKQRGYVSVPIPSASTDGDVQAVREAADELRRRAAHLDALAEAAGIAVPRRKDRRAYHA